MPEKIIEFSDDGVTARIVVRKASTTLDAVRHGLLRTEADSAQHDDPALRILHQGMYVHALVASQGEISINGASLQWPPDIHAFANLPIELTNQWIYAVYQLNPTWDPLGLAQEQQEKKASNGGSDASIG